MSYAGLKGKRKSHHTEERRAANQARRIARDAKRAKLMPCGHGSRHRHPGDNECRRCYGADR